MIRPVGNKRGIHWVRVANVRWRRVSRDDYESTDGRFAISRMPAEDNAYSNRDEWTLVDQGDGVDVFPRLSDAKEMANQLAAK
jgi:hypothetical protein